MLKILGESLWWTALVACLSLGWKLVQGVPNAFSVIPGDDFAGWFLAAAVVTLTGTLWLSLLSVILSFKLLTPEERKQFLTSLNTGA